MGKAFCVKLVFCVVSFGSCRMNPNSLMVLELVFQSKFLSGLIIIGPAGNPEKELKRVSKPVHKLVRRFPMKPWILQRLAAIMASAHEARAGVSDPDLDNSEESCG